MTDSEFKSLFNAEYLAVALFSLRMLADRAEAEDVAQEAFIKLWATDTDAVSPKSMLFRIARNLCIDKLRARHDMVSIDSVGADMAIGEDIDTAERDACLWRAIDALPPRCKEIFLMSKRDSMTYAEIADMLGIAEKTVENQMTKAFRQLRTALSKDFGRRGIPDNDALALAILLVVQWGF